MDLKHIQEYAITNLVPKEWEDIPVRYISLCILEKVGIMSTRFLTNEADILAEDLRSLFLLYAGLAHYRGDVWESVPFEVDPRFKEKRGTQKREDIIANIIRCVNLSDDWGIDGWFRLCWSLNLDPEVILFDTDAP